MADVFLTTLQDAKDNPRLSRDSLVEAQAADASLAPLFCLADEQAGDVLVAEGYYLQDGVLMQRWRSSTEPAEEWNVVHQVVLPHVYRESVLRMAHEGSVACHMGVRRTMDKIT